MMDVLSPPPPERQYITVGSVVVSRAAPCQTSDCRPNYSLNAVSPPGELVPTDGT